MYLIVLVILVFHFYRESPDIPPPEQIITIDDTQIRVSEGGQCRGQCHGICKENSGTVSWDL